MRWVVIALLGIGCGHRFDPLEARDLRATALAIGAEAPDAQVVSTSGRTVALAELLRGSQTVVVFYRGFY